MSNVTHRLVASSLTVLALFAFGCASTGERETPEAKAGGAEEPGATQGVTEPGGTAGPAKSEPARQDAGQGSLADQQRKFLVQDALQRATRLIQVNRFEEAEETLIKARDLDPENLEINRLLNEVQERLGKRVGQVKSWSEYMNRLLQVRLQKEKANATMLQDEAEKHMAAGEYDEAIRKLRKVQLNVEIGKRLDWGDIPQRNKELLQRAQREREEAETAKREAAERETFDRIQREEEARRKRIRSQINYLLSQATKNYENKNFREARRLAEEALRLNPNHDLAQDMATAAEKAFRDQVSDSYVLEKAKAYKKFFEASEERKIPYSDILTPPSADHWQSISRLRATVSAAEAIAAAKDPETLAIEKAISQTLLPKGLNFDETNGGYVEVIENINTMTDVPVLIAPEAKEAIEANSYVLTLSLGRPISLKNFLNVMVGRTEGALAYTIQDGAVILTTKAKSLGKPMIKVHQIADLTFPITNFAGPLIRDLPVGTAEESEVPRAGGEVGEKVRFVEPEALQTLIQESVARGTWDSEGVSIEVTPGNMIVVHTPEVQARVEQFLADLRKFQTSLVTVESKFLRVERNWLQQIGVDFRGLGGTNAKGTVAQLDDITNGLDDNASRGLDNSGTGDPNAHPSSGFFYDDGLDGDFRGRTENFFQNALGNVLSTTGGATFGFTILDDVELNILLRAVEKRENIEVVDAQTLTVLNGQRANISVINQTAYIQDFNVEVATASFIADPEVNVIQDGVVLDVRPTISYDRRYITLDLQPTVAELIRPIPTFTTSLSGSTLPVTIQFPNMTVRSAATTVKVPDGGSVLIGGLNEVLNVERRAQVPWIANLPLISFLFKEEGIVDENSSLMVLVKAYIINVKEFMESKPFAGGGTR